MATCLEHASPSSVVLNFTMYIFASKDVDVVADSALALLPSESEDHHSVRSQSPSSHCPSSPNGNPKPLGDTLRPKEPPSPAVYPDKARGPSEVPISKRSSSLLNSLRPPLPLQAKDGPHTINGRTKPWDSFTPEEFAQQFHESVLQSTQKALQKHKGKLQERMCRFDRRFFANKEQHASLLSQPIRTEVVEPS